MKVSCNSGDHSLFALPRYNVKRYKAALFVHQSCACLRLIFGAFATLRDSN